MRTSLAMLLAGTLLACTDGSDRSAESGARKSPDSTADKYIGLVHSESLPAGIQRLGWRFIDVWDDKGHALTAAGEGDRRMIWLDESHDADGRRQWKVVAVLEFEQLLQGEEIVLGTCKAPDIPTSDVIAFLTRPGPGAPPTVKRAWRVNRTTRKFDLIRSNVVVCP